MRIVTRPRIAALLTAGIGGLVWWWQGLSIPPDVVVLSVLLGLAYTLIAVAISLTYRISGVINVALGVTGALAVTVAALVRAYQMPWLVAVGAGVLTAAAIGGLTDTLIIRRLRHAPRLLVTMTTAALAVALASIGTQLIEAMPKNTTPTPAEPSWLPAFRIGDVVLTPSYSLLLVTVPVIGLGVALALTRTQLGLWFRAAADDRDLARTAGIPAGGLTAAGWAFAGVLVGIISLLGPFSAEFSARDKYPVLGIEPSTEVVFRLVVWPLAIAAIGRGRDVVAMTIAGVTLATVEQAVIWTSADPSWLAATVVTALLISAIVGPRPDHTRADPGRDWLSVQMDRGTPAAGEARAGWTRVVRVAVPAVALGLAVLFGARLDPTASIEGAIWIGLAVIGLAIFVDAGLTGSLSFGYLPIGAAGSAVCIYLVAQTGAIGIGFGAAVVTGAAIGVVLALIGQRAGVLVVGGITVAGAILATLFFARFSEDYPTPGLPVVDGAVVSARYMLALTAVIGLLALVLVRNLRASPAGNALVALRDNAPAARALGLDTGRLRLAAGALSGALAGLGGALMMQASPVTSPEYFRLYVCFAVVFAVCLGGLGSPTGPLVGLMIVFAVPLVAPESMRNLVNAGIGVGGLAIVLAFPSGLLGPLHWLRDRAVRIVHDRAGRSPVTRRAAGTSAPAPDTPTAPARRGRPGVLEVSHLRKSFGGVEAVRGVSLTVRPGEIVTLVGANGAGKTTLFDMLSGFVKPDGGYIRYGGRDITHLAAHERARLGIARTFQNAALFPTLTVSDVLSLAVTSRQPLPVTRGLLLIDPGRRHRGRDVRACLDRFGLTPYARHRVGELSTGTRRIVELAAATLFGADLLLLDEPSSGVAQREVENIGAALRKLRDDSGVSLLVIEHDIPLCQQIGDRMIVLAQGAVLATGPCVEVVQDPRVVRSYLGMDEEAVARSGALFLPRAGAGRLTDRLARRTPTGDVDHGNQ